MADVSTLRIARAPTTLAGVDRPGFRVEPEPFLGIAKILLHQDAPEDPVAAALGVPLPGRGREVEMGSLSCAWLAPGEWLLIGEEEQVASVASKCREALSQSVSLVTDLTHARTSYLVIGTAARDLLAAYCPLDLSDAVFPEGAVARSLFGDTGFFLSRRPDVQGAPSFRIIVDQSMSPYVVRLLGEPLSRAKGQL